MNHGTLQAALAKALHGTKVTAEPDTFYEGGTLLTVQWTMPGGGKFTFTQSWPADHTEMAQRLYRQLHRTHPTPEAALAHHTTSQALAARAMFEQLPLSKVEQTFDHGIHMT